MARLIVVFLCMMSLTVGAASAAGGTGNGPYEPFPAAGPGSQADPYYAQLGVSPGAQRIEAGAFLGRLAATRGAGGASHRAGVALPGAGTLGLLAALAATAVLLLAGQRRRRGAWT